MSEVIGFKKSTLFVLEFFIGLSSAYAAESLVVRIEWNNNIKWQVSVLIDWLLDWLFNLFCLISRLSNVVPLGIYRVLGYIPCYAATFGLSRWHSGSAWSWYACVPWYTVFSANGCLCYNAEDRTPSWRLPRHSNACWLVYLVLLKCLLQSPVADSARARSSERILTKLGWKVGMTLVLWYQYSRFTVCGRPLYPYYSPSPYYSGSCNGA